MKLANFDLTETRTFIIAELSANHGHSLETAKETIRAAKRAVADAIKLQTYTADTGERYCVNSLSLEFSEAGKKAE